MYRLPGTHTPKSLCILRHLFGQYELAEIDVLNLIRMAAGQLDTRLVGRLDLPMHIHQEDGVRTLIKYRQKILLTLFQPL